MQDHSASNGGRPKTFGWYRPWLSDLLRGSEPSAAKLVGSALAHLERDGVVTATASELGTLASSDESTVRRALDQLAAGGWITKRRSRYGLVVALVPRSGTTPELGAQIGHHARTEIGHHARPDRAPRPTLNPAGLQTAPPRPPRGQRRRDRDRYRVDLAAFAAQHFPGIDPGYVAHARDDLDRRGVPVTVDNLRPEIERWTT